MKNITLAVDDDVLAAVRKFAADKNTTVNGLVRDYLASISEQVRKEAAARARKELVRLSEETTFGLGDWKWNREELYDRPILSGHQHSDLRGLKGRRQEKKDSE
jgi:hypothetical protein